MFLQQSGTTMSDEPSLFHADACTLDIGTKEPVSSCGPGISSSTKHGTTSSSLKCTSNLTCLACVSVQRLQLVAADAELLHSIVRHGNIGQDVTRTRGLTGCCILYHLLHCTMPCQLEARHKAKGIRVSKTADPTRRHTQITGCGCTVRE